MNTVLNGLTYPLRAVPLTFIAIYTVCMTLAFHTGFGGVPAVTGIPLIVVMTSWFLKYAFVLFDAISLGQKEPPVLSYEMINPVSEQRPLGQLVVVAAYYFGCDTLRPLIGDHGVTALRCVGLLALPASVATLGVTGSLLQAVNPRTVWLLIYRLGPYYLAVLVCAGAFGAAVVWLRSKGMTYVLGSAGLVIAGTSYAWFAMFTILASVLYERRAALGLETWHSPEQEEKRLSTEVERERARVVNELYQHWRIHSYVNAWAALERHAAGTPQPLDTYFWIHERVNAWADPRFAERIAREHLLARLLAVRRTGDALNVVRARLEANPEFRPLHGADLLRLVTLARDAGDRPTARALLVDFERHFPGDPAQAVAEQLRGALAK